MATPLVLTIKRTQDPSSTPVDMRSLTADNTRGIVFYETDNDFRVNNHVFVGSRIDTRVPFGTTERYDAIVCGHAPTQRV